MRNREKFGAGACGAALCMLVGCAVLQALAPALPTLVQVLLDELDASLGAYESTAAAQIADPSSIRDTQAVQKARHALILEITACLLSDYPGVPVTDYLERLNTAAALAPDG